MLPDFELPPSVTPIYRGVQHRRPGIPYRRLGLHRCGNELFAGPNLESECHSQLCTCHPSWTDVALAWLLLGKHSVGPRILQLLSLPQSPPNGILLWEYPWQIKNWTRGTRVYQHHSGAWLQRAFLLLPKLEGRIVVFFWIPLAAPPELQACLSHPSEAQAESNVFLSPESRHSSNQATTHRQWFLHSPLGLLFLLVVRGVLRLILLVGSCIIQALSFLLAFAFVAFSLCRHLHKCLQQQVPSNRQTSKFAFLALFRLVPFVLESRFAVPFPLPLPEP